MPPDPPRVKGPHGPFSGHSRLLHLQWPLITNVIENPVIVALFSTKHGVPSQILTQNS